MPALATFTFQGYTLRPARQTDYELARAWTLADPDHRDTTQPDFWLDQKFATESYLLLDKWGPVFFFKLVRDGGMKGGEAEIHIQFPPVPQTGEARAEQNSRTINALIQGMTWIERILSLRLVSALFFTSRNPGLIRFCVKRLGFVREGERLVRRIEAMEPARRGG